MELWRCSTVGRLLWVNSARQGAAWQTGVLCDCQQEPPQIVWEPVCFFKLTIYYIYPSVCAEYIYKRCGVFSCLDDCLWTSSLPYPVFLSAVMSTSQRAKSQICYAPYGRDYLFICSACSSTSILENLVTAKNKHCKLCANPMSVDLNYSFLNSRFCSGKTISFYKQIAVIWYGYIRFTLGLILCLLS